MTFRQFRAFVVWPPIWSPSAQVDANRAPSNARKTNTRGSTCPVTNSAIVSNVTSVVKSPGCGGSVLCKGHSPKGADVGDAKARNHMPQGRDVLLGEFAVQEDGLGPVHQLRQRNLAEFSGERQLRRYGGGCAMQDHGTTDY